MCMKYNNMNLSIEEIEFGHNVISEIQMGRVIKMIYTSRKIIK